MAQCEHVNAEGKQCRRYAMALSGDGLCFYHSPTVSDEEKRAARAKGGRTSRRIELLDVGEIQPIEDAGDLKQFLNSLLVWLVEARINPMQARSLVSVANALRDVLALEIFELLQRLERLEDEVMEGGKQWRLLDEPLPSKSEDDSEA